MIQLTVPGKPMTVNASPKTNYWAVAKEIKTWRSDTAWHAKARRLRTPVKGPVTVHIRPQTPGRLSDAGACFWAAKGAVDGLVDAGLLVGDSPKYVSGLLLHAPVKAVLDALVIELEPWTK